MQIINPILFQGESRLGMWLWNPVWIVPNHTWSTILSVSAALSCRNVKWSMIKKEERKKTFVYVSALQNPFQKRRHTCSIHTTVLREETPTLRTAEREVLCFYKTSITGHGKIHQTLAPHESLSSKKCLSKMLICSSLSGLFADCHRVKRIRTKSHRI